MKSPLSIQNLQGAILEIRGAKVLIDSDVARIYGECRTGGKFPPVPKHRNTELPKH
jgi:hypothetical protein